VVVHRVDRQADDLGVALVELGFQLRHGAELGGAHGGEILGVREQHRVARADPLVEIDPALRGVGLEIGGFVADA